MNKLLPNIYINNYIVNIFLIFGALIIIKSSKTVNYVPHTAKLLHVHKHNSWLMLKSTIINLCKVFDIGINVVFANSVNTGFLLSIIPLQFIITFFPHLHTRHFNFYWSIFYVIFNRL